MQKLSSLVGSALTKYNLNSNAFALVVLWRMRKHVTDTFWPKYLEHISMDKFERNTVFINCNSSVMAQEIYFEKNNLIEHINKDFPDKNINIIIRANWLESGINNRYAQR